MAAMETQELTELKSSSGASNLGAMVRATELNELDMLDQLERIITRNYFDIGRPALANNVNDIQGVASSWLHHLRALPNANVMHEGRSLHILERLYLLHMESNPRPQPLAVSDLLSAWKLLQAEWETSAQVPQARRFSPSEYEIRPLVPIPVDDEELLRRQKMCASLRRELGMPGYGEVQEAQVQSAREKARAVVLANPMAEAGPVAGEVMRAKQAQAQRGAKSAVEKAQLPPESVEELVLRLGDEVDFAELIPTPVIEVKFVEFNRSWWIQYKRPLTAEDVKKYFPAFLEAKANAKRFPD